MESNCGAPVPGPAATSNRSIRDKHKTPTVSPTITMSSDVRTSRVCTRIDLLEDVLQCYLHRSPVGGGQDAAEIGIGEGYIRIAGIHMVWHVEGFRPKLYGLLLPNPKRSSQAHVDVDTSGTENVHRTHSAVCTQCRLLKCCGIQPGLDSPGGRIRRRKHLIRPLIVCSRQSIIQARCNR